ncbi:MAG: nitronate monooxygenase, partial [Candidatus Thiodiazotropha sp.]
MSPESPLQTAFSREAGIRVPLICGPMYPCSNPELVAAASQAGGIGIIQPVSMTFVHGHDFREGIRLIKSLTDKPIGMNALIEKSSRKYHERMENWVSIALDEGVRFFITSLGNPRWVVERVKAYDGIVYHDVTERKWALKGLDGGVDGLIAVNNRAGGHAGPLTQEQLLDQLGDLGVPLICAGGIGNEKQFAGAIQQGYAGCQLGTRFIATRECSAAMPYKQAILDAEERDIVLSNRITGIPVSIINTPYIARIGTKA